jgi:hypothetical protein
VGWDLERLEDPSGVQASRDRSLVTQRTL